MHLKGVKKGKNMKRYLVFLLLFGLILTGCSGDKSEQLFEDFSKHLINQDYTALYQLLSEESQQKISEEDFITLHSDIYSEIGASEIILEKDEEAEDEAVIHFSKTLETVAGTLSIPNVQLPYVQEDGELRIQWSEALIFPNLTAGDQVRARTETAERGSILDREGQVLAQGGTLNTVGIHPQTFDEELVDEIAKALDISPGVINDKLAANSNPEYFVPIVNILPDSQKLESLRNRESEGIMIRETSGRIYKNHEAFGRLLGYVSPITAEALEADEEGFYHQHSIIGQAGLEQVYETTLRGVNGVEIFIQREDVNVETLAIKEAKRGEDIQLTLDSDLQVKVYDAMNEERGSASAIDPTTGEILALVSSPSYNSNRYTTYLTRTEQARREANNLADEKNRFASVYSPGSTFKLHTAAIGLENGVIDSNKVESITGDQWQANSSWGNYYIRRINSQTQVSLREAIKFSDNIYFARQTLKMGEEKFLSGMDYFTIGSQLDIGFPLLESQISNSGALESDILLGDTGYGQGEILATTLNIAVDYSMLANNGKIMEPTLILEDGFQPTVLKENIVSEENLAILKDAFSAVIAESDGTGHLSKINGINLAGKTGTAEIKSAQGETGSENGWFVATDLDEGQISLAVMVEDVQDSVGTLGVVKMVRDVLAEYLK